MGFLRSERLSPEQLVSQHVRQLFSRKYGNGEYLVGDQLLVALQHHAGYVVSKVNPPRSLAEQVAKVVIMRLGGVLAGAKVERLISDLESSFVHNPQADVLSRGTLQ